MPDDIKTAISDSAKGPVEAESDGVRVRQHSLKDQIAADNHLDNQTAASKPHRGLRITKLIPPGAV